MRPEDRRAAYVGQALAAGQSRAGIAAALTAAGWSEAEAQAALSEWADGPGGLPVPRPRAAIGARDTFLYALMYISLASVIGYTITLGFTLIEAWMPEPWDAYGAGVDDTTIWALANLAVFLPIFVLLDRRMIRNRESDPAGGRSAIRAWLGHALLFFAAAALICDAVAIAFAYLNGEMTLRFMAKAALVAMSAGLVFLYLRGLTAPNEKDAPA